MGEKEREGGGGGGGANGMGRNNFQATRQNSRVRKHSWKTRNESNWGSGGDLLALPFAPSIRAEGSHNFEVEAACEQSSDFRGPVSPRNEIIQFTLEAAGEFLPPQTTR
jgi:hypothetical protein